MADKKVATQMASPHYVTRECSGLGYGARVARLAHRRCTDTTIDLTFHSLYDVLTMAIMDSVGQCAGVVLPVALPELKDQVVTVTPPLGAYPQPQPPQGPFLPAPPHQAAPQYGGHIPVAGGSPYGVTFGGAGAGAGGVYAPPPYDQLQHHQAIPALSQQLPMYSPAAAMYAAAAAGYPGYIGYPVQYYPYYPTAVQPSIQPLRPTIMIPNGFEAGGRFEGLAQTLLPPAPPGVPPSPAHLAAIQPHQVLWR